MKKEENYVWAKIFREEDDRETWRINRMDIPSKTCGQIYSSNSWNRMTECNENYR